MIAQDNKNDLLDRLKNLKSYMICFENIRAFRTMCVHMNPFREEYKKCILSAFPETVFIINEIETRGNFE